MSKQFKKALVSVSLCLSGFILCQAMPAQAKMEEGQFCQLEAENIQETGIVKDTSSNETSEQTKTAKPAKKENKPDKKDDKAILPAPQTLETTKTAYQSVTLSWSEVAGAAGYQVEVSTDGTSYRVLKKLDAQTRSAKCGKLLTGTDYTFRVCAVDEGGKAGNYSLVHGKPALKKAAFVSVQPSKEEGIFLEWKKVAGADSYQLYRKKTGESAYQLLTTTAEITYLDKDALLNGDADGTYSYYVQAIRLVNGKGVSGKASKKTTVEWKREPAKLVSVEALDHRSSKITWQSLGYVDGYYLYRGKKEDGAYSKIKTITKKDVTSYVDKGIVPGKRFYYKICAYTQPQGEDAVPLELSDPMSVKTELAAPKISSAQVNVNHRSLTISWERQKEATGYRLYKSVYSNKKFKEIAELASGTDITYEDRTVQPGGTYYYRVKSLYQNKKYTGISAASATQSGSTLPGSPNGLKIEQTATDQLKISWNETNGAASYKLYRRVGDTGAFTCIANGQQTDYTDVDVKDGQKYYYRVSALGTAGEGTKCTPVSFSAGGIQFDTRTLKLCVGASKQLKANTLRRGRIVWKSDNPKVASVDSNGTVTGVLAGTAKITATVSGKSAQMTVSVTPGVKNGIDVSVWQPEIDWARVKESGVDFAFLRISYHNSEDTTFETKYADASAVGMPLGVYCYSLATTEEEAQEEARTALRILNGRKLDYPIVLDIEDGTAHKQAGMTKDKLHSIVEAFRQEIEDAGYSFALYSYLSFFQTNLDPSRLTGTDLWVARYGKLSLGHGYSGTGNVRFWQYNSGQYSGSDFHVDGITDDTGNLVPVDVNVEYGVDG